MKESVFDCSVFIFSFFISSLLSSVDLSSTGLSCIEFSNVGFSNFGYYAGKLAIDKIQSLIEPSIMIQRMLSKAQEILDNNIVVDAYTKEDGLSAKIRSFAVYDYLHGILTSPENGYVINSNVLCAADYGAPQKRMRFVVIGIKKSISEKIALPKGRFDEDEYRTVREAISDLEDVNPIFSLEEDENA